MYAGSRVNGPHGLLFPNLNGGKHRVKERVYGTIVKAVGQRKWGVKFDFDGGVMDVSSNLLQLAE